MKNQWISREARENLSHERACEEHMTGSWRVVPGCRFRKCPTGKAFLWDTRETFCFARLCYTHTIYTHITHKSWGVIQREKPSHKPWELEIVIPTYLYTFACGFSLTPTSPFPYHWEVDNSNTYHTLSECQMRFWCCWEVLEEAKDGRCNMELVAGSGELDKTRFREALLE